jgi:hypothetical protein
MRSEVMKHSGKTRQEALSVGCEVEDVPNDENG